MDVEVRAALKTRAAKLAAFRSGQIDIMWNYGG